MFYNRDWQLDEETDFRINIAPNMNGNQAAHPAYIESVMIGWFVKGLYE